MHLTFEISCKNIRLAWWFAYSIHAEIEDVGCNNEVTFHIVAQRGFVMSLGGNVL